MVGRTVEAKLKAAVILEPDATLLLVHRDADSPNANHRHEEINNAATSAGITTPLVAVVPVQETEAWLLTDETAIRQVAKNPRGRNPLTLPSPQRIESTASPKEVLKSALLQAAEVTGRRQRKFVAEFPAQRRQLLQRLPLGGNLSFLSSWIRLRDDINHVIATIAASRS
ncbi:DUF4276 family protein [Geobacter sp. 60473]|uniref:DUF4276 family protein n=1 Tax=Geobacter sp. 60473 TaxID=3080755 RepID=UPI0030C65D38